MDSLIRSYLSDSSLVLAATTTLCLVVVLSLRQYSANRHSYWAKRGVSGPKAWPVAGNMVQMISGKRRQILAEWRRQFGLVYGIYEGLRPTLMVADPEVARKIAIKDSDLFPNHDSQLLVGELNRNFIFLLKDERWRHVRSVLSPTFTSGKMRRMYKLMELCVDDLSAALGEQFQGKAEREGPIVQLKDLFDLFTMDAIASCCYGIKLERAKEATSLKAAAGRNEFVQMALQMFHFRIWRIIMSICISKRLLKWFNFTIVPRSTIEPFVKRVAKLIEVRRVGTKKFDDYLQILLDAGDQGEESPAKEALATEKDLDSAEAHHAGLASEQEQSSQLEPSSKSGQRKLDEITILSSAVFLLAVGLETTGTLLTHCVYTLAYHKQIQDKLHAEVAKIAKPRSTGTGWSFDYDTLTTCNYLDAVISETLRAHPPAQQTDREVSCEYLVEEYNIKLAPGSKVLILLADIMNNEKYWPNPDTFDPERFMPENRDKIVPGSYCPFGLGPRHCLGMRFSLTEAKFALARLSMDFEFEPAPNMTYPPAYKPNFGFGAMKNPYVRVLRRPSVITAN